MSSVPGGGGTPPAADDDHVEEGAHHHQPGDAPALTRPQRQRPRRRRSGKEPLPMWQETLLLLVTAVILALVIKTFFVQAFYIPSGSMRDTLRINDRILVEKVSYWFGDVHRGDVVVFDDPANWLGEEGAQQPHNIVTKGLAAIGLYPTGGHLVKRVIGVGGDLVSCSAGHVYVNHAVLQESSYVTLAQRSCQGSWRVRVPPGHLWVLGDNRNHSADSRAHMGDPGGGFIPVADVVGKVFVVIWPVSHWSVIGTPVTFKDPRISQAVGGVGGPVALGIAAMPWVFHRRRNRKGAHYDNDVPERR